MGAPGVAQGIQQSIRSRSGMAAEMRARSSGNGSSRLSRVAAFSSILLQYLKVGLADLNSTPEFRNIVLTAPKLSEGGGWRI